MGKEKKIISQFKPDSDEERHCENEVDHVRLGILLALETRNASIRRIEMRLPRDRESKESNQSHNELAS